MPTDISNAVGTARQFTPQADNLYQGSYGGVSASHAAASPSTSLDLLSQNMEKLNSALQGYMVNHEKYMDTKGHIEAQNMINGMSAGAIKTLNTIDAAQLEGYADSMSNPYFKAYADKLRGGFMSTQMKLEYDNQYGMTPARNMDEEAQRYADFSDKWKQSHTSGDKAPENQIAFDSGFNENQLVNVGKLTQDWTKKKHEDDITNVFAAVKSQLGSIITSSPELLQNEGTATSTIQQIFNQTRLMGLPAPYRQKLLEDFTDEFVKTGHIGAEQLENILNNVTVMTDIGGGSTKASELLDMQSLKTSAAEYSRQFMTKWKYDTINHFIQTKDYDGYFKLLEDTRRNNPDKAREVADMWSPINVGIKQQEAEAKRVAEAKRKERLEYNKAQLQKQQEDDTLRGALKVHMDGGTMYNGQTIRSIKVDPKTAGSLLAESVDYVIGLDGNGNFKNDNDMSPNTRMQYLANIMSFPPFAQARTDIVNQYSSSIDSIQPSQDGGAVCSQTAYNLVNLYQANSADFTSAFGTDLAAKVGIISLFANARGDLNAGVADYAAYNITDKNVREDFESSARYQLAGYTMEGMPVLGGGLTTARAYESADATKMLSKVAGALMCAGMYAPEDAVNRAASIVKDNLLYYQGAYIPKGTFNNIGTSNDEAYFAKAMNRFNYGMSPTGNADIRYNAGTQMFLISGENGSSSVSLDSIRKSAYDIYAEEVNNGGPKEYSYDINSINADRDAAFDDTTQSMID